MTIYFSIFGRGRLLTVHEFDMDRDCMVYFRLGKLRRGLVVRQISFEGTNDGGVMFRRTKDGRSQGWKLQGPVQHFDYF